MQKTLAISAITLSVAALSATSAQAVSTSTQQEITALGSITAGALAGGPLGAVAGLLGGVWLVEKIGQAGTAESAAASLADANAALDAGSQRVAMLELALADARAEREQMARSMLESLQVALLFRTGDSSLTDGGIQRLGSLASYLKRNPDVTIRVAGYADPRGDDQANLSLSQARAARVAEQLIAFGVPEERLSVNGFGESESVAAAGDVDGFALERRVVIELTREQALSAR